MTLFAFPQCRPGVHSIRTCGRPLRTVRPCTCADIVHLPSLVLQASSTAGFPEPCTSSRDLLLWSRFALDTVTQENYIHIPAEGEQLKWYQNPVHPFCIAANILW